MSIHKILFKRSLVIFLAAGLMFVLSACSTENARKTESYVSSVKSLVNEAVNNTRALKIRCDEFNVNDTQTSKIYTSNLITLEDLYEQVLKLESPDDYDELDEQVKTNAEGALSTVTEILNLVQYALDNKNDSLYQKDKDELFEEYQKYYDTLVELSSEVQTKYRND